MYGKDQNVSTFSTNSATRARVKTIRHSGALRSLTIWFERQFVALRSSHKNQNQAGNKVQYGTMLTFKKIYLLVAVSSSAFVLWPQVVSGIVLPIEARTKMHLANPYGRNNLPPEGKHQDFVSAMIEAAEQDSELGERANGYTPICVELRENYKTPIQEFFGDFRDFFVSIPQGSTFTCEATGGSGGNTFSLDMFTISDRFCSINSSNEDIECSIGDGTEVVQISVFYQGPTTRINLVCTNQPCIPATCGDGERY